MCIYLQKEKETIVVMGLHPPLNGSLGSFALLLCSGHHMMHAQSSLCTDVPPPSEKIGRRDVCESLTIIVFLHVFPECWGRPLIGCNVNAMMQMIASVLLGE